MGNGTRNEGLADAEARQREQTGKAVMGISSGLPRFDEMTNGLSAALYVLAGGPEMGKTTMAVQMVVHAASQGVPVVYVSYENSPSNIVLKAISARARVAASAVERGYRRPCEVARCGVRAPVCPSTSGRR